MSEWRPEDGWDSYWDAWRLLPDSRTRRSLNRVDFEAGADAMLAALRKQDIREFSTLVGWVDGNPSGTLVYIPDKE